MAIQQGTGKRQGRGRGKRTVEADYTWIVLGESFWRAGWVESSWLLLGQCSSK